MSEASPPHNTSLFLARTEFQPSARMTGIARSFLAPNAKGQSFRYVSHKSGMMYHDAAFEAQKNGTFLRLDQMAKNYETPLYPTGVVRIELTKVALRLLFEMNPAAEAQMDVFGNRLHTLEKDHFEPNDATNAIVLKTEPKFAASEDRIAESRHIFEEKMKDEFSLRGYAFGSKGIVVKPFDEDLG